MPPSSLTTLSFKTPILRNLPTPDIQNCHVNLKRKITKHDFLNLKLIQKQWLDIHPNTKIKRVDKPRGHHMTKQNLSLTWQLIVSNYASLNVFVITRVKRVEQWKSFVLKSAENHYIKFCINCSSWNLNNKWWSEHS